MLNLDFLAAETPLTKTYTKTKSGIVKIPYPMTWEFTSHREKVSTLAGFERVLKKHAGLGHCLLKGNLNKPLVKESRAGSTDTNAVTGWVCLDFDGVKVSSISQVMTLMGLGNVSYIIQHSASSGVFDNTLRAHVFFILDKPVTAPALKQWLIFINHSITELREAMALTKTGNAISWPLDISACQNDKLIYIAPPTFKGLEDPFKGKSRITLVKRKADTYALPFITTVEKNKGLTQQRLSELREEAGLPKRTAKYKLHGTTEVLVKPDSAVITDMKAERGFVYFNLNGGDSWAYYHPENNPEFVHNFKGEPSYLTKELLPEYWEQLTGSATKTDSHGITYLAFLDRKTSVYWRGTYDQANDVLAIDPAKNETQVRHFAKQHGMPIGDFIPEWDLVFDPKDTVRVDFQNRVINQFSPSEFFKAAVPAKQVTKIPPTIFKVIHHALGGDPEIVEHFVNWCAYIVQERERTQTAWVLHGVPGTGKGALTTRILRPLLGPEHTTMRRMEELNEVYNAYMRKSLLVVVDEVQTKALQNEGAVMAKLKNFITEEYVPIRAMYSNGVEARNYTNWIFCSNMSDPVLIDKNDRRFNVGRYQPDRLDLSKAELAQIERELQGFFNYLLYYPCDHNKAHSVIDTADRTTMIGIGESSIDTVASALLEGNFEFLMEQLPSTSRYYDSPVSRPKLENYRHVLTQLITRTHPKTNRCNISREELREIFEFVIGNMPNTPNKFTSLLKHHRVHMTKIWLDSKPVQGITTTWKTQAEFSEYLDTLAPKIVAKVTPIAAGATKKAKTA